MAIKRFEDIRAWQKARELVGEVYRISGTGVFGRDFALRDNIRRAAVSVMSNIAEGFARRGEREFANFLSMAHGSAAETQSHLYVALDLDYINKGTFDDLWSKAEEVSRMIQAFWSYLLQYRRTKQGKELRVKEAALSFHSLEAES